MKNLFTTLLIALTLTSCTKEAYMGELGMREMPVGIEHPCMEAGDYVLVTYIYGYEYRTRFTIASNGNVFYNEDISVGPVNDVFDDECNFHMVLPWLDGEQPVEFIIPHTPDAEHEWSGGYSLGTPLITDAFHIEKAK